ncbi:MAG: threonine synthase [Deltaproteobacteria bacterium]|nr:threonine synthase [Deltaproteobacteria bacterium]
MTSLCCIECGRAARVFSGAVACARCGGLLDPVRDDARLVKTRAATWRALVARRASSADEIDRSGVWTFREWVLPELGAKDVVTLGEGRTPLVRGPAIAPKVELWVKQCGQQPTGSFKDLGMTVLVSAARAIARRRRLDALVCASTGDTSAALAAYGARAGLPVVVLLPKGKVSPAQLLQPLAHGAHVVEIDGDFDACMRVVRELGARAGILLANSKNPLRLLGQATVAFEIARDLGWRAPDVVVVPSGNLGNVAAMHSGFSLLRSLRLIDRLPRLVAAQVAAADPLHRARARGYATLEPMTAGETLATAIRIGDPVSFPRARRALVESGGTTTSVDEDALKHGMAALDAHGLLSCPQTGAAFAGARRLAQDGTIRRGERVVVVSTASGLKFVEAKAAVQTNAPLAAPARLGAVLEVLGLPRAGVA